MNINQQKLAEKLIILNDRSIGMLTRIYNIKKACSDTKSKPTFLCDRQLEGALKLIVKKFPNNDVRSNSSTFSHVKEIRMEIIKSLSLYYYTFADLLELKDHICELLTTIDACQVTFDITLNFDLTSTYLSLISNYISLLILLSRVDDRKAVLGLFNVAYEIQNSASDTSFPRLGQMIMQYEVPLKQLADDFVPHRRTLLAAVASLQSVYVRRNLTADQMRGAQLLSLIAAPNQLLYVAQTDTMPCEYMSMDAMERWIVLSLCVCHGDSALTTSSQGILSRMWQTALEGSLCLCLYRDETLNIHPYVQSYFEHIKGYGKRLSDVKDFYTTAVHHAGMIHRERRKYLRSTLRELCLMLRDEPGLLGPKVLFVFMALAFSRDEVLWLLRHREMWPQDKKPTGKSHANRAQENLADRQLPELLFYMEELRRLVFRYEQVIRRYYVQYVSGYDSVAISQLVQRMSNVGDDDSRIMSAFCNTLAQLNLEQLETCAEWDFAGPRLDWCRLQAYMSVSRAPVHLATEGNRKFAQAMNAAVFHLRLLDQLDELVQDTSDLSIYCFYTRQLEEQFQWCLEFPSQTRYAIAFPLVCAHFMNSLHDLCPEERHHVGEKSLSLCNVFLDEMCKEAKNIITNICNEYCTLADTLLPKNVARLIAEAMAKRRKTMSKQERKAAERGEQQQQLHVVMPGDESYRQRRENLTALDKLYYTLTELCFSLNNSSTIIVWNHVFAPREYLTQHLENRFNRAVVAMAMYDGERQIIAKPSELLNSVKAYMHVLQSVENHVNIDVSRIFNNVLVQQTQGLDCRGDDTITALYTKWYLEVLLRRVSTCQILYCPYQRCFINNEHINTPVDATGPLTFNAQEYTDTCELRALAELLGAYGVKFLSERLIWHVASQICELKKLVVQNRDVLRAMRTSYDKPEKMRELFRQLTVNDATRKTLDVVDNLLQRLTIVGEILSFKDILQESLSDVMQERIPFLTSSIDEFARNVGEEHPEQLGISEMCSAAGIQSNVDAALVSAMRAKMRDEPVGEEDYHNCCLLVVFIAVSIGKLAKTDATTYKATLSAHLNNAHCIAAAVNAITSSLFTLHARGDVVERMKEMLALASSSLLHMGASEEQTKTKESVYLLLEQIVDASPFLTQDLLESCFPYVLMRSCYHYCYSIDTNSQVAVAQAAHQQHAQTS